MMEPNGADDVSKLMHELIGCIEQGVRQQTDLKLAIATAYAQAAATASEFAALVKTLSEQGALQPAIYRANCVKVLNERIARMRTPQLLVPHAVNGHG